MKKWKFKIDGDIIADVAGYVLLVLTVLAFALFFLTFFAYLSTAKADPNIVEIKQAQLVQLLEELPAKRRALESKTYPANKSWNELTELRRIDVNEVKTKAMQVRKSARELCEVSGLDPNKAEALKIVVERVRRKAVNIDKGDTTIEDGKPVRPNPKQPPVIEDPNYRSEVDQIHTNIEILDAVADMAAEPNFWPDPNDPNYIEEMERTTEFLTVVNKICNPS